MKKYRLVCMFLALLLSCSSVTGIASAAEAASEYIPRGSDIISEFEELQVSSIPGTYELFGTNPPSILSGTHDLSKSDYVGSFSGVVYSVYTDKRFKSNASGYVYLKITTDEDCIVTLHDANDGSESPYSVPAKQTKYIYWSGMDTTHKYYFQFEEETSSFANPMSGDFTISHSSLR